MLLPPQYQREIKLDDPLKSLSTNKITCFYEIVIQVIEQPPIQYFLPFSILLFILNVCLDGK